MEISILHLSDIHFKVNKNVVSNRLEKIFDSVKNEIKGKEKVFIITSGDIAYSGKTDEYKVALDFYKTLYQKIESYTGIKCFFLFVPGNHDCYFDATDDAVRNLILKNFSTYGLNELSETVIDECCKPQKNYFNFTEEINKHLHNNGDIVFDHKLLKIQTFKFGDFIVKFNLYNSSWDSKTHEQIGSLKFPIEYLNDKIPTQPNVLSISIVHHPLNWQSPGNSLLFRTELINSSEIIITGHEHQIAKSIISDFEQEYNTIHIESGALQESLNDARSEFNLINLDIAKSEIQIINFKYNQSANYEITSRSEWKKIEKEKKTKSRDFSIQESFLSKLEDAGATYYSQNVDEITLDEIFIPPILNNITVNEKKRTRILNFVNTDLVFDTIGSNTTFHKIIMGSESSGKTAILRYYYKKYYNKGFYPILINADSIDEVGVEKIKTLVGKEFKKQYHEIDSKYEQLDFTKIILMIDDFHRFKFKKGKGVLVANLKKIFNNIIITGSEILIFDTYVDKNDNSRDLFEDFDRYMIQELNPTLRYQLITKWFRLGRDYIDETERTAFLKSLDNAAQTISEIIGKNFIPSFPFFILSILQNFDNSDAESSANKMHAYYYEVLITKSIKQSLDDKEDIGFYMTLAKEYFYFLFANKIRFSPIEKPAFIRFLDSHFAKYRIVNISREHIIRTLVESKIIRLDASENVSIAYKYLYYYFVARFIADNIDQSDIREKVDLMTDRIYRDEYSNIILFLTHLSRNNYVISKLVEKSRSIFSEFSPIKLEEDVSFINEMQASLPEEILRNIKMEDIRTEELSEQDKHEQREKEFEEQDLGKEYDWNEDLTTLDLFSQLTKAIRTIKILGQLTKRYWGELPGNDKYDLAEETFLLSMRTLAFHFSLIKDSKDWLMEHIKGLIQKKFVKDEITRLQVEDISANFVFMLSRVSAYSLFKLTVNSIGSDKLSNTFMEIEEAHPYNSTALINVGIKLDQNYNNFPVQTVDKMKQKADKNPLCQSILQSFVIDHLYMFPVDFDVKQQICSQHNIKMDEQLVIAETSQIKKV